VIACFVFCCSVLQRVAVCCSELQCITVQKNAPTSDTQKNATCCSVLQCVAVCCSASCTAAVRWYVLQRSKTHLHVILRQIQRVAVCNPACCSVLQRVAVCPTRFAVCCSTWLCVASQHNTPARDNQKDLTRHHMRVCSYIRGSVLQCVAYDVVCPTRVAVCCSALQHSTTHLHVILTLI